GGVAYVYDPSGRFISLCNGAMVELDEVAPAEGPSDVPGHPRQHSISADNSGMGDMLRFDAERLRILVERHLLHTGSARAREILDNWDANLPYFVKVMPKDYRRALTDMAAEQTAVVVAAE
ncbi:MAG TPA: hypothetical protein VGM25_06080, partial [Caulobacteraceae bacterium]